MRQVKVVKQGMKRRALLKAMAGVPVMGLMVQEFSKKLALDKQVQENVIRKPH